MTPDRYRRTARTRLKRRPDRAAYDVEAVHAVLDAGLLAHVGYAIDGVPYVTPTCYWRDGAAVYWHGGASGRMLRHQEAGAEVCFTVTHFDGVVLARSAFHHSANYRSVMAFGRSEAVTDRDEKAAQLDRFMERIAPGRSAQARRASPRELRLTTVMRLPLDEVVLKSRSGPPGDDDADMALDVWAGALPVTTRVGAPEPDPQLRPGIRTPRGLRALETN
jgi:nitroimidazol reductase NimA-like FMN-containing flavoprotein (pyridoxamine 5'-phosphate oxidase superfamily)